jgi:hypothetical protein
LKELLADEEAVTSAANDNWVAHTIATSKRSFFILLFLKVFIYLQEKEGRSCQHVIGLKNKRLPFPGSYEVLHDRAAGVRFYNSFVLLSGVQCINIIV